MDFLPSGRVTGIGSLPHLHPDEAVNFISRFSPEIPFWPQLPQRSPHEIMIQQTLTPLLDLLDMESPTRFRIRNNNLNGFYKCLNEVEAVLIEENASGFFAFERGCDNNLFPNAIALKAQITGPIALSWCIFYKDTPLSAMPDYYPALVGYICRLAEWQITRLKKFGKPVIIFVDEPMLVVESKSYLADGVTQVIKIINQQNASSGIHCCATPPPASICSFKPDIISFDAHQGLESFLSQSDAREFMHSNGCVSFGVVPTWEILENFNPSGAFVRLVTAIHEYFNVETIAKRSFITATCGLGLLNIKAAEDSFLKATELSRLLQKVLV